GMVRATIDPLTGQVATPYCPHRTTEYFPEWQAPVEPCRRHMPGYTDGEVYADATLGEPYDAYGPYGSYETERPRYVVTDDGLEIVYPDEGDAPSLGGGEAMTFPPSGGTSDFGEGSEEAGSIIIRPARERQEPPVTSPAAPVTIPTSPAPAPAPAPAPRPGPPPPAIAAPTPSVVTPNGQPIGQAGGPAEDSGEEAADEGPPPPVWHAS
ncbi:MAG TPA: hypothetical protein VLE27_03895, partial [Thermoanaerobaculia bacterium]|nr:hypothetical protein [Thermoanaerobaculia bacterium]